MKDYNQIVNAFNFQTSDRLEKMQRQVDEYQRQRRNQTMIPAKNMDAISVGSGKGAFVFGRRGLVKRSGLSTSTVTGLTNGNQFINQMTVSTFSNAARKELDITEGSESDAFVDNNLFAIVERVVYVGSRSNANVLPGGSAIDESQWQVIGDFYSHRKTDGTNVGDSSTQAEIVNWRYVRNISAGTVDVIIDIYVRWINFGGIE